MEAETEHRVTVCFTVRAASEVAAERDFANWLADAEIETHYTVYDEATIVRVEIAKHKT